MKTHPFALIFPLVTLALAACHRRDAAPSDEPPIACRLGVFTPAERARQQELREQIAGAAVGVDEVSDGYRLRFPDDPALLARIAEWIPLERRCCPFLAFDVEWPVGKVGPSLHLGGRAGVKEFLAAEMK